MLAAIHLATVGRSDDANELQVPALISANPAIGDWQLPSRRCAKARSASQQCHAFTSFSARTSAMLRCIVRAAFDADDALAHGGHGLLEAEIVP